MPVLGLETAADPFQGPETVVKQLLEAIALGYRISYNLCLQTTGPLTVVDIGISMPPIISRCVTLDMADL